MTVDDELLEQYRDCRRAGLAPRHVARLLRVSYRDAIDGLAEAAAWDRNPVLALAARQCGCELRVAEVEEESPFGDAFPPRVLPVAAPAEEAIQLRYSPLSVAVQRYSEAV